jgi:hypothetical protein
MPLRLNKQCPEGPQINWCVADQPVLICVEVASGRGGLLALVFTADEASVHKFFQILFPNLRIPTYDLQSFQ